ncbi:hypothetical protein [Erwinia tracheiphila]|uniref:hypothetical protein n=1 Tax=Erwinia tracheiphila TaxID=65700 RepID=UPI00039C9585|nr:hypothetical protein [Erwinia tracheiphila]UIA83632.1 hypothetical protein LU604_00185 [Erwinia tracheiphila]
MPASLENVILHLPHYFEPQVAENITAGVLETVVRYLIISHTFLIFICQINGNTKMGRRPHRQKHHAGGMPQHD